MYKSQSYRGKPGYNKGDYLKDRKPLFGQKVFWEFKIYNMSHHSFWGKQGSYNELLLKQMLVHSFHLPRPTKTYSNLVCFAVPIYLVSWSSYQNTFDSASLEFSGYLYSRAKTSFSRKLRNPYFCMS